MKGRKGFLHLSIIDLSSKWGIFPFNKIHWCSQKEGWKDIIIYCPIGNQMSRNLIIANSGSRTDAVNKFHFSRATPFAFLALYLLMIYLSREKKNMYLDRFNITEECHYINDITDIAADTCTCTRLNSEIRSTWWRKQDRLP